MRMFRRVLSIAIVFAMCFSWAGAMTRDELRAAYREIALRRSHASPYQENPDVRNYTTPGSLTAQAQAEALDYLNFIRMIAGLEAVELSPLYVFRSQNGALLLWTSSPKVFPLSTPRQPPFVRITKCPFTFLNSATARTSSKLFKANISAQ